MKPIYGRPMDTDKALKDLSDPETIENMAWALRDWAEADQWLQDNGAPITHDNDIWLSLKEKFQWVLENVPHDQII